MLNIRDTDELARRQLVMLTAKALETGTFDAFIERLNYLRTYGYKDVPAECDDARLNVVLANPTRCTLYYGMGMPESGINFVMERAMLLDGEIRYRESMFGGLVFHPSDNTWATHT
jgi:hypothetical protein